MRIFALRIALAFCEHAASNAIAFGFRLSRMLSRRADDARWALRYEQARTHGANARGSEAWS